MARKLRKFTSRLGGTEGDNWILKGVSPNFEKAPYGKHIIVSDIEHPAIKESAAWLKTQGFVDYAPVDARGFVKVDALVFSVRIRPWSRHGRQQ